MEVYKIADSIIAARLNDIVARNWYPFKANESINDADVQLVWDNSAQFSYGVYSFKPEYSEHILKSDTSVLFANGDFGLCAQQCSGRHGRVRLWLRLRLWLRKIRTLR